MSELEIISLKISIILSDDATAVYKKKDIYTKLGLKLGGDFYDLNKYSENNTFVFFNAMLVRHFGKFCNYQDAINKLSKVLDELKLTSCKIKIRAQYPQIQREEEIATALSKYTIRGPKTIGNALIVNFVKFADSSKNRQGALKDIPKLKTLCTQLSITYSPLSNLTREEFFEEVKNFIDEFDSNDPNKICLVIILSHSGTIKDCFLTKDGQDISVENELLPLFGDHELKVKNKPKIFVFGFCDGDTVITDSLVHADGLELNDMFCIWSTITDRYSMRDVEFGTWFIDSFCKVTEDNFKDHEIQDIMQLVDEDLRQQEIFDENGNIKQQCVYCALNFKRFYFKKTEQK